MRKIEIPLEKLLPIEASLRWRNVWRINCTYIDKNHFPPIPVIQYEDSFVLGDGHSRSAVLALNGEKTVPANVLENNADIANCSTGAFDKKIRFQIDTIDQFLRQYERVWRPGCLARGVKCFTDLLEGRKKVPLWMDIMYTFTDIH